MRWLQCPREAFPNPPNSLPAWRIFNLTNFGNLLTTFPFQTINIKVYWWLFSEAIFWGERVHPPPTPCTPKEACYLVNMWRWWEGEWGGGDFPVPPQPNLASPSCVKGFRNSEADSQVYCLSIPWATSFFPPRGDTSCMVLPGYKVNKF